MGRRAILLGWARIPFGLAVFALGVHLTIRANLGLAPWDCFGMGISYHTPLNYGLSMTAMSVFILAIDLLMGESIGFGTVIDALITGNLVQFFNVVDTLPETDGVVAGTLVIVAGLALMALGQFFYMGAAQGCGPRDALLVGLGKRLPKLPIGAVQAILWGAVLLAGWLLDGPVGVGTLIGTFGSGPVMQVVFDMLDFEPRDVVHRDIVETVRTLKRTGDAGA